MNLHLGNMDTITKENYSFYKNAIKEYEDKQKEIKKLKGVQQCPFCMGSKITPFTGISKSQECNQCNENGMITKKKLFELGLERLT